MSNYLIIESRDPYESNAVREHIDLAVALRRAGHRVAFFLVQNGVLPARAEARCELIPRALDAGVEVLADDFSLRERGIGATSKGVQTAPLEHVVQRLAAGWKTFFC